MGRQECCICDSISLSDCFFIDNVYEGNLPGLMFKKLNKRNQCLRWMMPKKLKKPQGLLSSVFFLGSSHCTITYCTDVVSVWSRICFKRRSARLRPEEAEPCKSFHERDEVKETIKGRRFVTA